MHPTHMQWFYTLSLLGLCVCLLVVVQETRHNDRALHDPAWWFWVVMLAGVLAGIIPYLLVHFLGLGR